MVHDHGFFQQFAKLPSLPQRAKLWMTAACAVLELVLVGTHRDDARDFARSVAATAASFRPAVDQLALARQAGQRVDLDLQLTTSGRSSQNADTNASALSVAQNAAPQAMGMDAALSRLRRISADSAAAASTPVSANP